MATGKRYYWMKLRKEFMDSDIFDFLMSQPNGSDYVMLYFMLCMQTINTNGRLVQQIGEITVSYDINKIQRTCKFFDYDTIAVAIELFKKIGLICEEDGQGFKIANYDKMVGSDLDYTIQKRRQRLRGVDNSVDNGVDNDEKMSTQSIENKSIEYRVLRERDRGRAREGEREKRTNKFVLCEADASRIMHSWNALGVSSVKSISNNRLTLVKARIAEHGLDVFLEAIKNINESPFLLGQNERGWVITFDWLIKPSNFAKVLEGNYKPRVTQSVMQQTKKTASSNFTERKNDIDAEALQKVARKFGVSKDGE
jgi:hypothetical protein